MSETDKDAAVRFLARRLGLDPSHVDPDSVTVEGIGGVERVTWSSSALVEPGFGDALIREASTTSAAMRDRPAAETVVRVWDHLADKPQPFTCSVQALADEMGLSRTHVSKCLKMLLNAGDVVINRKGSGPGFPTTYTVVREPA